MSAVETPSQFPRRNTIIVNKALSKKSEVLDIPISCIKVVGNPTMAVENGVFHFTLSLPLDDVDAGSESLNEIRLDNSPSYTDMNHLTRGVVFVQYLTGEESSSFTAVPEPFTATLKTHDGKAVAASQIFSVLFNGENKLDQYEFTNEGHGCRHWCATALRTLACAGLLGVDTDETKIEAKYRAWEDEQGARWSVDRFPMPRIQGKFYTL